MLKALYSVYDRRRRPLRDHHYMVFASIGIAYARVPGDSFKAISKLICRLAGTSSVDLGNTTEPLNSDAWNSDMELLTARELKRRHPDFIVFTVVQPPEERVASAYNTIIQSQDPLPAYFEANQFSKSMSLESFTSRIAGLSDTVADNLLRSQASILSYRSNIVPGMVVELSELRRSPEHLLNYLREHTGKDHMSRKQTHKELNLDNIKFDVPGPDQHHLQTLASLPMQDLLRQRYQMDYRLFFSAQPSVESLVINRQKDGHQSDRIGN
ncbi:sulfotransferase family 2 domain-containing protein [Roseibium algae]|uniref:Sulfotransferase family 2 domain-containing protein n=1 Tax=Roseibium algae TaxID=3123038 RepID=A0ABU8TPA5_9HYPH